MPESDYIKHPDGYFGDEFFHKLTRSIGGLSPDELEARARRRIDAVPVEGPLGVMSARERLMYQADLEAGQRPGAKRDAFNIDLPDSVLAELARSGSTKLRALAPAQPSTTGTLVEDTVAAGVIGAGIAYAGGAKSGGVNHLYKSDPNDTRERVPFTPAVAAIAAGVIGAGPTVTTPTTVSADVSAGVGDAVTGALLNSPTGGQQGGLPSGFVEVPGPTPVSLPGAAIVGGAIGGNPAMDQPGGPVGPPKPVAPPPPVDGRGNKLPPGAFLDGFFNRNKPDP